MNTIQESKAVTYGLKRCLHLLSIRSRSEQELTTYLAKIMYDDQPLNPEIIDAILYKIKEFNLLNDNSFALDWARAQIAKGKGWRAIEYQLKHKGLSEQAIQQAKDELDSDTLLDAARNIAQKKAARLKTTLKPWQRRAAMQRYLYSRGYNSEIVNAIIDDKGQVRVE